MDNYFIHNLLVFVRLLRSLGLDVSPAQVSDLARVLERIGVARRDDFYYAARALFVRRREDLPLYDRAFDLFFRIQGQPQTSVIAPTQQPVQRGRRPTTIQQMLEREWQRAQKPASAAHHELTDIDSARTYSPTESLRQKNFEQFSADEIREARRMIAEMHWQVGERKTRRKRSALQGSQLDFTRLVRRNLKYGAELFHLPKREPKFKPRPLVVLADISGSMERYTRMLLHLLHALSHEMKHVEVFVFGTRLTRITPYLKKRCVDEALARVTRHVVDWSGGTRIGEAIKTFNFKWARRVLRTGAVVLIISDGWDRGDLELLRDEMARLQRSCFRLIWLSPLTGQPPAEAASQGLKVVLPFVDDFLPVHNLVSLEMLAAKLSTLGDARPLRKQLPSVVLPSRAVEMEQKFVERPQMGTSDYVRRTMTLRTVDGVPLVGYEENPDRAL